ncbi:hypothetical protein AX15_003271 [Amanita polypyramis BW_CC]|nr:hypothetical protein AX15_003271 [Amanita polypyramis BW_CC]
MPGSPSLISAVIHYGIKPADGIQAYQTVNTNPKTGLRDKNWTLEAKEVQIENIRGKEDTVSLDTTGFQFYKRPAKHKSFASDEEIKKEYYPESEELLKELTGAASVIVFDHTVRRVNPGVIDDGPSKRQPSPQAHGDQTTAGAIARLRRHLPDEAPELVKRRFQIINLWRPIEVPALELPLALCDYRSVDPENDVFAVKFIFPERVGENMSIQYNPNHKWKYLPGMTPDEFVLIKW